MEIVEAGPVAAVRQVDHEPGLVELLHQLMSEGAERGVLGRHGAAAHHIAVVIGDLHHADAAGLVFVHPLQAIADLDRILEAVDQADLALRLRAGELRRPGDPGQVLGAARDDGVPFVEPLEGDLVRIARAEHIAQGDVDGAEPRGPGVGDGAVIDPDPTAAGPQMSRLAEGEVRIVEPAQGVDPDRTGRPGEGRAAGGQGGGAKGEGLATGEHQPSFRAAASASGW
jgi:hypothetical protein